MGEIRNQSISGIKWTAIEKFSIQGVNFLIGILLARLLTPADYGLIGILGIFFAISQTLIDSGFSNALIRKKDCTENDYSTAFYFNIAVSLACSAILFFGAPLIAAFFKQPQLDAITKVYCLNLFFGSLCGIQYAKLTKDIKFKPQAKVNFFSAIISGVVGIIMAYSGFGVWALVGQSIAANVARVIAMYIVYPWCPRLVFSKESFHELFGYGSKLMMAGLLHTVYTQLTTILIGRFYTPAALGNYSRGTALAELPNSTLSSILQRVTFPIFAKLQDDDARLIAVYRNYIRLMSMLLCILCITMAAVAKPLILILLTQKWAGAIIFLQIFIFAVIFDPLCILNLNLLQIKGRSDLFLKLEVYKKIISMAMLIAAVPFGVIAICVIKVVYTQIAVAFNTYYTGKLFGIGYWQQMRDFLPYVIYSMMSAVPAAMLSYMQNNSWIALIVGPIVSIAVYLFTLRRVKDEAYLAFLEPMIMKTIEKIRIKSK